MFDAKKLKERRLEKGLTQADVYEDLKISRKTYSSWENGLAEPHEKNLRRLAKRLSVKEDYFINKDSALYTFYDNETDYETVYFDQEIQHDFASWVSGNSMEPLYPNGSVALMKQTGFDYDGAVYALMWNGKTYIKKVYREAEGLRLESINPDYDDLFAPYEDEPKIVGIVVGHFLPLEV